MIIASPGTEPSGIAAIHATRDSYLSGTLRAKLAKYHSHPDVAFNGWYQAWTDPGFANWNVADAIDHLRIPVLAIQGSDDSYGTPAQITEIESRIYAPLETLIIDDCGHNPHLEKPDVTLAAISDFCARLNRLERHHVALS